MRRPSTHHDAAPRDLRHRRAASGARRLDAPIEGLIMHGTLSTTPFPRELTRQAVLRALQDRP